MAIIWSFYGDKVEVSLLMQRLSHKTRAYFINANLLKGFLKSCNISRILLNTTKEENKQALLELPEYVRQAPGFEVCLRKTGLRAD